MPLNDLVGVKIINSTEYWMCTHMSFVGKATIGKVKMLFVDFTLCGVFFSLLLQRGKHYGKSYVMELVIYLT